MSQFQRLVAVAYETQRPQILHPAPRRPPSARSWSIKIPRPPRASGRPTASSTTQRKRSRSRTSRRALQRWKPQPRIQASDDDGREREMKLKMLGRLSRLEEAGKETRPGIDPYVTSPLPAGLAVPTLERPLFLMALPKCNGVTSSPSSPFVGKAAGSPPAREH